MQFFPCKSKHQLVSYSSYLWVFPQYSSTPSPHAKWAPALGATGSFPPGNPLHHLLPLPLIPHWPLPQNSPFKPWRGTGSISLPFCVTPFCTSPSHFISIPRSILDAQSGGSHSAPLDTLCWVGCVQTIMTQEELQRKCIILQIFSSIPPSVLRNKPKRP